MSRLAEQLSIEVDSDTLQALAEAARFDRMRSRAERFVPDRLGVIKDPAAFFRQGLSGEGRLLARPDDLAVYEARAAALAPPDLLDWLDR
jgi:aryl sulfotransferase